MELSKLPIGEVINDGNIILIYYPSGIDGRNYIPVSTITNYKISMDTERTYFSTTDWPTEKKYYYITIYSDKNSWSFGYSYDYKECVKTLETLLDKIYPKQSRTYVTMPK